MKRLVFVLLPLSILLFACNVSTTVTPPVQTVPPVVTETLPVQTVPPVVTETPSVTEPPVVQPNVICNEVSLYVDPVLASGHDCKTIPESSQDAPTFDASPQHTELTLQGYPLADRFFSPHLSIYPVQRFSEIVPETVPQRVTDLMALIGGGPVGDQGLPLLPVFNAAQEFYAQYNVIAFQSGSGIRFLTQYSQAADPINNHEMFFTFQGLTSDGKYWISAILPVSNPILPADGNNPPNGQSWDQFSTNFVPYIADMQTQLNNQAAGSFTPTITALDALVASITIQP